MINRNHGLSRARTVAAAAVKDSKKTGPLVQELLQLVEGTDRGLSTPAQVQASILSKVGELKAADSGSETTSDQVLSATWKVSCIAKGIHRVHAAGSPIELSRFASYRSDTC